MIGRTVAVPVSAVRTFAHPVWPSRYSGASTRLLTQGTSVSMGGYDRKRGAEDETVRKISPQPTDTSTNALPSANAWSPPI